MFSAAVVCSFINQGQQNPGLTDFHQKLLYVLVRLFHFHGKTSICSQNRLQGWEIKALHFQDRWREGSRRFIMFGLILWPSGSLQSHKFSGIYRNCCSVQPCTLAPLISFIGMHDTNQDFSCQILGNCFDSKQISRRSFIKKEEQFILCHLVC